VRPASSSAKARIRARTTGDGQYLFPRQGDRFRPMSENTVNKERAADGFTSLEASNEMAA
jgi:hypothetical protein